MTLKIAWVGHTDHFEDLAVGPFYKAMAQRHDVRFTFVEDGWPERIEDVSGHEDADACLWFVRFRLLSTRPGFDWGSFGGRRLMMDTDVNANYHRLAQDATHAGQWPPVFRRFGFDTMVTTGKRVAELLADDGINAMWIPKGYDPERVHPLGLERAGICYFGQRYASRRAMLAKLDRRRVPYERFSNRDQFNELLNTYLGGLICNLSGDLRGPFAGKLQRLVPSLVVRLGPGLEPMIKNFEVAGAGCAPIADWIPELADHGFVDGESMVAYRDLDELVERCRHYLARPDDLARIGERAADLASTHHTWGHRADVFEERFVASTP